MLACAVAILLPVAACSSHTTGSPSGAPSTSATPTTATRGAGTDPLADVDPCSLLPASTLAKNGLGQGRATTANGARICAYARSEELGNGYGLGVDIFDHTGYQDFDHRSGMQITDHAVDGHDGLLIRDTAGKACLVNVGVTSTSHVEISVDPDSGDVEQACSVAEGAAETVVGDLPGG